MTNWIEIKDFNTPELGLYASLSEVQLLRYYEPKPGLFIAESPKVIQRAVNAGYEPISFLVEHKDLEGAAKEILAQFPETPVYTAEYDVLIKLTGFALTRGMLCAMETASAAVCRGNLSKCLQSSSTGKCGKPNQYRCDFSFCRSLTYGRSAAYRRMLRPSLSKSCQSEYGNCFPDSMDLF